MSPLIIIYLSFFIFIVFSALINIACPIFDKLIIESQVKADLDKNKYTIYNLKSCSKENISKFNIIACNIFSQTEFNKTNIINAVGNNYEFKKKYIYNFESESIGILSDILTAISPTYYDVTLFKYTNKYKTKWDYSKINALENYSIIYKRFMTIKSTPYPYTNKLVAKFGDKLITVTAVENGIYTEMTHKNIEKHFIFKKIKKHNKAIKTIRSRSFGRAKIRAPLI